VVFCGSIIGLTKIGVITKVVIFIFVWYWYSSHCTEYVVLLLVDGSSEVLHLNGWGGRLARRFGGVLSWTTIDSLENGLWVHELRCEIRIVRTYKTACYTIRTFQIFLKYRADEF